MHEDFSMIKQRGFTLIEVAVVLVVIGLLAGGILKGNQMIENAKYKAWVKEIDTYRNAFYSFQDRYKALPGDFRFASSRLPQVLGVNPRDGNGNGMIDWISACSGAPTNACEPNAVNQQLILAGLLPGDPSDTAPSCRASPIGGFACAYTTGIWGNGVVGHKIIYYNVPVYLAERLDQEFDDGKANTGTISCHIYLNGSTYNWCPATAAWPGREYTASIAIVL